LGNLQRKRRKALCCMGILLVCIVLFFAFDVRLKLRVYTVPYEKIKSPIRIAMISDLHSQYFGEEQKKLVTLLEQEKPDIIAYTGDIADDVKPNDNTIALLKALEGKYPAFYVSGNHEFWNGEMETIKETFRSYGVKVLQGEKEKITVNGQEIVMCGVDDPEVGEDVFQEQLENAVKGVAKESFSVLLSHRPERILQYELYPYDLVLSGHAHGGQWRIPFLFNGIYAPNQGRFPQYAGGVYEGDNQTCIVSRGLTYTSTRVPRIFNPPELVVVEIVPK